MSNLRLRVIATAVLSAGALLAGPVASADAAPSASAERASVAPEINWYHGAAPTSPCASHRGALCAYWDSSWGGRVAYFALDNRNWRDTDNAWINDESSSWYNNGTASTYDSVVIYKEKDWPTGGLKVCIDRGWGIRYHSTLNDQVSSNQWVPGPCPS